MATNWKRLGELIKARREALDLTQEQVSAGGGPSVYTIRLLEGGERASYRKRSLEDIERALGWAPGSCRAVLAGGDPVIAGEPGQAQDDPLAKVEDPVVAAMLRRQQGILEATRREVEALQRQLADLLDRNDGGNGDTSQRSA